MRVRRLEVGVVKWVLTVIVVMGMNGYNHIFVIRNLFIVTIVLFLLLSILLLYPFSYSNTPAPLLSSLAFLAMIIDVQETPQECLSAIGNN